MSANENPTLTIVVKVENPEPPAPSLVPLEEEAVYEMLMAAPGYISHDEMRKTRREAARAICALFGQPQPQGATVDQEELVARMVAHFDDVRPLGLNGIAATAIDWLAENGYISGPLASSGGEVERLQRRVAECKQVEDGMITDIATLAGQSASTQAALAKAEGLVLDAGMQLTIRNMVAYCKDMWNEMLPGRVEAVITHLDRLAAAQEEHHAG